MLHGPDKEATMKWVPWSPGFACVGEPARCCLCFQPCAIIERRSARGRLGGDGSYSLCPHGVLIHHFPGRVGKSQGSTRKAGRSGEIPRGWLFMKGVQKILLGGPAQWTSLPPSHPLLILPPIVLRTPSQRALLTLNACDSKVEVFPNG